MKKVAFLWLLLLPAGVLAQVNFEKGPENTDCHLITDEFSSASAYIVEVTTRSFRVTETITISRFQSPRSLEFFSCDGKNGFVVAVTGDSTAALHENVPLSVWQSFTEQRDIVGFYAGEFSERYPVWIPE